MTTELEKNLKRLKVTIKATALAATPCRGFTPTARPWRVSLTREIGEEKPLRLTIMGLSENEPVAKEVLRWLVDDIEAGDLNLWEFAQEFNGGKDSAATESMHSACRRVDKKVRRFFGESWGKIAGKIDL
jgi:hypothetical protein